MKITEEYLTTEEHLLEHPNVTEEAKAYLNQKMPNLIWEEFYNLQHLFKQHPEQITLNKVKSMIQEVMFI